MNKEALKQLDGFTGTERYYKVRPGLLLTDGTKFLVENADCYWLIDIIWSYQTLCKKDEMLQGMQFWKLVKKAETDRGCGFATKNGLLTRAKAARATDAAYAVCERDTGDAAIVQAIPYTDFPFDVFPNGLTLWVGPLDEENMVVYLPSEH